MSHLNKRIDRLEQQAAKAETLARHVRELSDPELAALVAKASGLTVAEVLALSDQALEELAGGGGPNSRA